MISIRRVSLVLNLKINTFQRLSVDKINRRIKCEGFFVSKIKTSKRISF